VVPDSGKLFQTRESKTPNKIITSIQGGKIFQIKTIFPETGRFYLQEDNTKTKEKKILPPSPNSSAEYILLICVDCIAVAVAIPTLLIPVRCSYMP
jgi:hypothetical protein